MNLQYITLLISAVIIGILIFMKAKKVNFGVRVFAAISLELLLVQYLRAVH